MSHPFEFTYLPEPQTDPKTGKYLGDIFRPKVPVRISYKGGKYGLWWSSLVDSGSDRNLFPAEMGIQVGVNIKSSKAVKITGIGKIEIMAYPHPIELQIGNCSFHTVADFCYEQEVPLLGRFGFFNFFKHIDFRDREKRVMFKY